MRVFLDTNVLISAFISRGTCDELFQHCAKHHLLFTSLFVLDEFREKLLTKFKLSAPDVRDVLVLFSSRMTVVNPTQVPSVCRDPEDNQILAAAVTARCECLVTGDRDLLDLQTHEGIPIIKPGDFWALEKAISGA